MVDKITDGIPLFYPKPIDKLNLTKDHYEQLWRIGMGAGMKCFFFFDNNIEMSSQLYRAGYCKVGNDGLELTFKGRWALHCYRYRCV
jgi:hypothetical protein